MSGLHESSDRVRIMWVNPVGFADFDAPIADWLAKAKHPGTNVELVSLHQQRFTKHLEYRVYEALVMGDLMHVARYAAQHRFDALVSGCFYDPGLEHARTIAGGMIVVAPCQAAVQIMTSLCNRFSVIVGQQFWIEQMTERIHNYGQGHRLASMRPVNLGVDDFQKDRARTEQRLLDAARRAVEEDHAEGLILGCTLQLDFFQEIQKALAVPVIDAVLAAFKCAEYLGGLKQRFGWAQSNRWSMTQPPEHELRQFGVFDVPPPIGNRIRIP
jgi:allantoin racemase